MSDKIHHHHHRDHVMKKERSKEKRIDDWRDTKENHRRTSKHEDAPDDIKNEQSTKSRDQDPANERERKFRKSAVRRVKTTSHKLDKNKDETVGRNRSTKREGVVVKERKNESERSHHRTPSTHQRLADGNSRKKDQAVQGIQENLKNTKEESSRRKHQTKEKESRNQHEQKKNDSPKSKQKDDKTTSKMSSKMVSRHEKKQQPRNHYSDSEIEQNRSKSTFNETITRDKSDFSSFYSIFHDEDMECDIGDDQRTKASRRSSDTTTTKQKKAEQSTIRNKLIKVLFKRVKELLKETEQLRHDRKEMNQQIEDLSNQVEKLKGRTEDHQSPRLLKMKEMTDALTNRMDVVWTGKTLKVELHNILHDIQSKYASHWREHERNIQEVQSHAENEIQHLMSNVMDKYLQINDLRDRTSSVSAMSDYPMFTHRLERDNNKEDYESDAMKYMKPLLVETSPLVEKQETTLQRYRKDLLLKVAEPRRCSSNITSTLPSFEKFDTIKPRVDDEYNLPRDVRRESIESHATIQIQQPSYKSSLIPKKVTAVKTTNTAGKDNKEDLKEFWKHRLLQPNPSETLQRDREETMRNQF